MCCDLDDVPFTRYLLEFIGPFRVTCLRKLQLSNKVSKERHIDTLEKKQCRLDIRKFYFSQITVN